MMESNSWRRFVLGGLKQSAIVYGILWVLGVIAWFAYVSNVSILRSLGLVALKIVGSMLFGPIPRLLTYFDINDRTFLLLTVVLTVPYWCCFGAAAGIIRWRIARSSPDMTASVFVERVQKQMRWLVGAIAVVLAAISYPSGPSATGNLIYGGPTTASRIMNNLRQIDGAKQQLALEKKLPTDYVPTEAELSPYLGREYGPAIRRVGPERYVINSIGKSPCAVLDEDWRIPRRGWRQGYTILRQEWRLQ